MKLKYTVCIFLVLCLLFAVGCGGNETSSQAETSAEESVKPEPKNATEYTKKIDSLLSENVDKSQTRVNVAFEKDYDTSRASHSDYPDKGGALLTDGKVPAGFAKDVWAGYNSPSHEILVIDLDLDDVYENILELHTHVLHYMDYGIAAPAYVKYYISKDGKSYDLIGTAYREQTPVEGAAIDMALYLQGGVSFEYLRIETAAPGNVWLFVGEVEVIAYNDEYKGEGKPTGTVGDEYYGFKGIPTADTEEFWPEGETANVVNLVSGTTPTASCEALFTPDFATAWYNTANMSPLTDGRKATVKSYSDSAFVHFTRGDYRNIYFDIGKISAVKGFCADFLRDGDAGVNLPRYVTVALSKDGKDWQTVFKQENVSALDEHAIVEVSATFDKLYKARFVRLSFFVNVHTYISEFEVSGYRNVKNAVDITPDSEGGGGNEGAGKYIMPDDFCGVHNIILSYNCLPSDAGNSTESGLASKEEYLPYVGYYDKDGNLVDTMFDGFLYLPYTRFNYSAQAQKLTGWNIYLDDIYYEDRNMDALEAAADEVFSELGVDDKLKVFTSILYTFPTVNDETNVFGDVDGDGKDEVFDNIEDRKKAIKWIMDEELRRFNEGEYENLDFCGYYWFEESITYSDPHEVELIRFASDYAHKLGKKLFWIPYQQASGYMDWEALGFDLACMQPNYMFNDNATSAVLYTTAEQTKSLGMCVEMEMNDVNNAQDFARFTEYMIAGADTGYMNAVKIYYQNGLPGAFAASCNSPKENLRKLYDDVYLYAKEKYAPSSIEEVEISGSPFAFECKVNEKKKFTLDIEKELLLGKIQITLSPRYGAIMLNADGTFYYFPPEDYAGTDSFEFCITDGHTCTKTAVVNITIG